MLGKSKPTERHDPSPTLYKKKHSVFISFVSSSFIFVKTRTFPRIEGKEFHWKKKQRKS